VDHMTTVFLVFLQNLPTIFLSGCTNLLPTNSVGGFPFLHTLSSISLSFSFFLFFFLYFILFFLNLFLFHIGVWLICNVMLVLGVQQSDSVTHVHISILFQILLSRRLL